MNRFRKLPGPSVGLLILTLIAGAAIAQQSRQSMMMDGCMMMSGWAMAIYVVFGALLFIALILTILALLKYLFGKKV